jgi:hypothetical protein
MTRQHKPKPVAIGIRVNQTAPEDLRTSTYYLRM